MDELMEVLQEEFSKQAQRYLEASRAVDISEQTATARYNASLVMHGVNICLLNTMGRLRRKRAAEMKPKEEQDA